ncbi:hypothetical protein [Nonomuraea sp. NPDC048916]|uniref:hypothetical protein n=1 Tax=Nonomuraea sp. NPDC048916 TaxID=3154232 RepID=UPI0033D77C6D
MGEEWLAEADERRTDPSDVDARARSTVITAMGLAIGILHEHQGPRRRPVHPGGRAAALPRPALTPQEAAEIRAAVAGLVGLVGLVGLRHRDMRAD